jgi:predicted permease
MSRSEPTWRRYLTFWRPDVDRDLDAEIRFHFDERVTDLMRLGRSEKDARDEAEREFGDRDLYRMRMREIDNRLQARKNRAEWFAVLMADCRLSFRAMRRAPGLTLAVIVTLALGIGANSAVFSMLDRIYLRPPPGVLAPHELRRFVGDYQAPPPQTGYVRQVFGYAEVKKIRAALGAQTVVGYRSTTARMGTADDSPMAQVADVFGDYFGVLGVRPAIGRLLLRDDLNEAGPPPVAVVSHRFWKHQYGGDSSIVGRTVEIQRQRFTVVGVAAAGFDGLDLDAIDVWRPADSRGPYYGEGTASIRLLTRLGANANELAIAQLANNAIHTDDPGMANRTTVRMASIASARNGGFDFKEGAIAKRLAGVTLIVLLIAVANVANLLLTRAIQRRREIAIRVSLGISRSRLAAQLVTESALLALLAGVAALAVATVGAVLMRKLLLPDIRWSEGPFDIRLMGYTFVVALLAGLSAGLFPFIRAGRFDLAAAMRGSAGDGGQRSRSRSMLIVAQAALSVVLLVGAALFVHSLRAVEGLDLGFDTQGMILAGVASGKEVIPVAQREAGLLTVRERVARIPGVRGAAATNLPPMGGLSMTEMHFPGRDSLPQTAGGPPTFTAVDPDYFRAAGVSILAGRAFVATDRDGSERVMVVTKTMARVAWPGKNALGQCVKIGPVESPCTTVVGISEDVRRGKVVEDEMLLFYLPMAQAPGFARGAYSLVIGTDPAFVDKIRREVRSVILSVFPGSRPDVVSFAEKLDPQYRPWRIGARLFTAFGMLALLVAAIGIYSAIAYTVTQRTHELGVRLALGAQRSQVGQMVIGGGVRLVGAGVIVGVLASLGLSRLVESLLYGTNSRDPIVLGGVAAILVVVAVVAAAVPAWRAARLDPVRALRSE